MAITRPVYCTREDVRDALEWAPSVRDDARIDREIEAAAATVEGLLHRRFYPQIDTRYFPWPDDQMGRTWRLWLDADELISVTTLSSGGTAITGADYFLEPANAGPPFDRLEIDLASAAAFGGGSTHQRDITITGLWGYAANDEVAGALAEVLDTSETAVDVTNSAAVGVGDLIRIDTERLLVTGKTMLTTGQTLQGAVTAAASATSIAVTTGSAYTAGETILIDAERMRITDITGNTLIVERAVDGTVLATHNGGTIYAPRTLTVIRGAAGTTAATHDTATAITRHVVPGPVRQLAIAEAITGLQQQAAGYARTIGTGEAQREAFGRGIRDLREQVYTAYGRKARLGVV